MLQELLAAVAATGSAGVLYAVSAARVVKQYERGVVFRLGRLAGDVRPPGFTTVVPFVDRLRKDVSPPDTMKRSTARQAEADRKRRARIINADAGLQAPEKPAETAEQMPEQPAALRLRLLRTVVAVTAGKNSTLVLPFPVELLRFLEKAQERPVAR
jgi:regulator of protease activity HflC (stomatin/prohibitin superfamily)